MVRNCRILGYPGFLILTSLMAAFLFCSPACASPAQDLPGTWNVVAELVAASTEDPTDPYAPKPGMIKPDTWTIYNGDSGPMLSGSIGSCRPVHR
jgi:hypothetical protein